MRLVFDPDPDEVPDSTGDDDGHAEEEEHVEEELICEAVIYDEGDDDAEDYEGVATLDREGLFEGEDLEEDRADCEVHGEFVGWISY